MTNRMRPLSQALLAAQTSSERFPYLEVKAQQSRLNWENLYSGIGVPCKHSATIIPNGTIIRARITPLADGSKLYVQAVPPPYIAADFENWQYLNEYNVAQISLAQNADVINLFYILTSRRIKRLTSTDGGATWQGPEIVDYTPTTYVNGLSACYNAEGEVFVFFADLDTLYVKRTSNGAWKARTSWVHQSGDLAGIAALYNGDFLLLISGESYAGEPSLWRLMYGDGGNYPEGEWSQLLPLISAPANSGFTFDCVTIANTGTFHAFYNQTYEGAGGYINTMHLQSVSESFIDYHWSEPKRFEKTAVDGYSLTRQGSFLWLCSSNYVYRANLEKETVDISQDVLFAQCSLEKTRGELTLDLDNSTGIYTNLPQELKPGGVITFSLGYVTPDRPEVSHGLAFNILKCEHLSGGGRAVLRIFASDG